MHGGDGHLCHAILIGMPLRMPNFLASYEQVETTPRPFPPFGSAPTTTGLPFNAGFSRSSHAAKKASRSRWRIIRCFWGEGMR